MKKLQFVHCVTLVAALVVGPKVMADPPVVHQSTAPGTPAVLGENTAEGGAGVFGQANATAVLKGMRTSKKLAKPVNIE